MRPPEVVDALGALAHEHRLAIYRLLVERGPDGLAAGNIGGLIVHHRASRPLIYAADFARMNALLGFLTENCRGGGGNACVPG